MALKRLLFLAAFCLIGVLSCSAQNGGYCPDCTTGGEHGCRYVQVAGYMAPGCFCHFDGERCRYTGSLCSCITVGIGIICNCDGPAAAIPEAMKQKLAAEKNPEQLAANLSMLSGKDTVESVKARWVKLFKDDPDGMVEIFHVGGESCLSQMVYTLGILEAGVATGHPVEFMKGGSSDTDPSESKLKQ